MQTDEKRALEELEHVRFGAGWQHVRERCRAERAQDRGNDLNRVVPKERTDRVRDGDVAKRRGRAQTLSPRLHERAPLHEYRVAGACYDGAREVAA